MRTVLDVLASSYSDPAGDKRPLELNSISQNELATYCYPEGTNPTDIKYQEFCKNVSDTYRRQLTLNFSAKEYEADSLYEDMLYGRFLFSPGILRAFNSGAVRSLSFLHENIEDFTEEEILDLNREIIKATHSYKCHIINETEEFQVSDLVSELNELREESPTEYLIVCSDPRNECFIDKLPELNKIPGILLAVYINKDFPQVPFMDFFEKALANKGYDDISIGIFDAQMADVEYNGVVKTGFVNLAAFITRQPDLQNPNYSATFAKASDTFAARINLAGLMQQIHRAINYLNSLVSPSTSIHLNFVGLAEVFAELNIEYDSFEASNINKLITAVVNGTIGISETMGDTYQCQCISEDFADLGIYLGEDSLGMFYLKHFTIPNEKINASRYARRLKDMFEMVYQLNGKGILGDETFKEDFAGVVNRFISGEVKNLFVSSLQSCPVIANIFSVTDSVAPIEWLTLKNPKDGSEIKHPTLSKYMDSSLIQLPAWLRGRYEISHDTIINVTYAPWLHLSDGNACIKLDFSSDLNPETIWNEFKNLNDVNSSATLLFHYSESAHNRIQELRKRATEFERNLDEQLALEKQNHPELDKESLIQDIVNSFNPTNTDFESEKPKKKSLGDANKMQEYERPLVLNGMTERADTPFGSIYVTTNVLEGKIMECFIKLGKNGSDIQALIEAIARLISIGLQNGVPLEKYTSTLDSIIGKEMWDYNGTEVYSVPDLIAKILTNLEGRISEVEQ